MEEKREKRKIVIASIFVIVFIIVVVFAIIFAVIEARKTAILDILVAPENSEIRLNGQKYENGSYKVFPGEYTVKITHEELEPYDGFMEIKAGDDAKLYIYLVGKDGDMSWYLTHENDDMILTGIGDYYAEVESQKYVESDPIFLITPYYDYNNGFKVNAAKGDEKTEIIVYLYTCDDARMEVLKKNALVWLNDQNVNLDDYNLSYKYCSE